MPGQCQADSDCAENERCNNGTCEEIIEVECRNDMDCEGELVCRENECVEGPMGVIGNPEVGELIVTEIMYNPHNGLSDNDAEWIEVYNASDRALLLDGWHADEGSAMGVGPAPVELNGNLAAGEYLMVALG